MRDSPVHGAERELGQRRSWLGGRTRGPRGQEVLLPASLEAEHWRMGGQARIGSVLVIRLPRRLGQQKAMDATH